MFASRFLSRLDVKPLNLEVRHVLARGGPRILTPCARLLPINRNNTLLSLLVSYEWVHASCRRAGEEVRRATSKPPC